MVNSWRAAGGRSCRLGRGARTAENAFDYRVDVRSPRDNLVYAAFQSAIVHLLSPHALKEAMAQRRPQPRPPLLALSPPLQIRPAAEGGEIFKGPAQIANAFAAGRHRKHDRGPPAVGPGRDREHSRQLLSDPVGARLVRFVHREDVSNLHDPSLERLDVVPQ